MVALWLLPFAGLCWYLCRSAARLWAGWRSDEEDEARALRIQREYMVPEGAVEAVVVPKRPRSEPEMTGQYNRVVNR